MFGVGLSISPSGVNYRRVCIVLCIFVFRFIRVRVLTVFRSSPGFFSSYCFVIVIRFRLTSRTTPSFICQSLIVAIIYTQSVTPNQNLSSLFWFIISRCAGFVIHLCIFFLNIVCIIEPARWMRNERSENPHLNIISRPSIKKRWGLIICIPSAPHFFFNFIKYYLKL